MRSLLLDTSAYSALFRGHQHLADAVRSADTIFLNPVVLGELQAGFLQGLHRERNQAQLRDFLASPRVRTLGIDGETAERYAAIVHYLRKKGRPIPTNDVWIAASAMQHGLRLVTADAHYLELPQILVEHVGLPR